MHQKTSGRSLAVRVGALTAAVTLMFAGGVAMAATASAANDNGNGNNGGQGNTGQGQGGGVGNNNNNGGAIHGDNGPNKNPNNGSSQGGNGSDLNGGTGNVPVKICHATRSAQNPYVLVTSDFSSVDEAILWIQGGASGKATSGNGHGDHVGFIWDGQRSGTNWGDIISAVVVDGKTWYPGYNLDANSVALKGNGQSILDANCNVVPETTEICKASGDTWVAETVSVPAPEGSKPWTGNPADCTTPPPPPPGCTDAAGCVERTAAPSAPICRVVDGKYNGKGLVTVAPAATGKGADETAAQNAANAAGEAALLVALNAEATGDNIIPPYGAFAGYNWNDKTKARFNDGNCSEVLSVISATPLPATIAPAAGKPAPAKVPASATLPGSVPAGDGSQAPALPLWALAMVVAGAIGAAAAGSQLLGNRK